jgi:hypothetical protein
MMDAVKRCLPALLLALAGCPDSTGTGKDGPAVVDSSSAQGPTSATTATPTSKDPLAGSIFTRDDVHELYRAEAAAAADPTPERLAEKKRVLAKHRLIDDEGREVPARARAYERALQALGQDEEGWSAFVETLDR